MIQINQRLARMWIALGPRFLPFADAATVELPLGRLLRLSLFQVSVGMAVVLLNGTLNRVMIVELQVPTWLVALMISLPLVFAPFRALVGFRSDTHRSFLGWRRVPYIWLGTMLQFGGFAIMPFALLVLSGDTHGPAWVGQVGAALAFLLVGAGLHTTQTAGLALATDLAPEGARPRVVAFLYVLSLVGMVGSSLAFGAALVDFDQIRLIQVIQGAALITVVLNAIALWKQEPRRPALTLPDRKRQAFRDALKSLRAKGLSVRALVAVGLGTAAFSMQDILLEPYGGEVLKMSVGETTALTAFLATGTLAGLWLASRLLARDVDAYRLAGYGAVLGILAFSAVIFAAPLESRPLFLLGTTLIGFSGGLFAVGTLTAVMDLARDGQGGLVLGAWGAVQASAAGIGIALGGLVRDVISALAANGTLGPAMAGPSVGYSVVYHIEIALLFCSLVALGPLASRRIRERRQGASSRFGLAEMPG
jgi:BCD family chlorophyll transporter-like MFS transporter